jgi:hypothetical protein
MKYISSSLAALAFASMAVQAQAQDATSAPPDTDAAAPAQPDTSPPPATPAPDTDTSPADTAAPPAASQASDAGVSGESTIQVSEAEIDQFAQATVKVQKINADTSLDDAAKQKQMADAVTAAGLDAARYNEIGQALATDGALRAKVQMAMAKYATPSQG